jgi:hypothetical protein
MSAIAGGFGSILGYLGAEVAGAAGSRSLRQRPRLLYYIRRAYMSWTDSPTDSPESRRVAESTVFERLLWPEHFYNDLTIRSFMNLSLLHPMGGPLHRAALETLDTFRAHDLYSGPRRGNMLRTAFMRDQNHQYFARTSENEAKEVRNGFLLEVMGKVKRHTTGVTTATENRYLNWPCDRGSRRRMPSS